MSTVDPAAERSLAADRRWAERWPERPLLIGEAWSKTGRGWPALTGRSGDRIAKLAGIDVPGRRPALSLMLRSERINVFPDWPGASRSGKGSSFPIAEARLRASEILRDMASRKVLRGRRVVFVGNRVAEAFRYLEPLMTWTRYRPPQLLGGEEFFACRIPHPSGVSHYWNSEERTAAAAAFFPTIFADWSKVAGLRQLEAG